jgi:hypothetical protein
MANSTGDSYIRRYVVITVLWLLAMFLGGLLLLNFGEPLRELLA